MIINIKNTHKSIKAPCEFELPNFSVLTGKNGSGKTHLLEAMSQTGVSEIKIDTEIVNNIRYISFNGLNPKIEEVCDPNSITEHIKGVWKRFKTALQRNTHKGRNLLDDTLRFISNQNDRKFIEKALRESRKTLINITEDDLIDSFDISFMKEEDFFTAQFALIFKNYHRKYEENSINEYYQFKGKEVHKPVLSHDDFIKKFGPPPWEFVNSILAETNIPYEVNNPEGDRIDSNFVLKLKDITKGFEISSENLSTGEKVLMSLALAIYNTGGDLVKPEILLIDEPDAGLHPSMSKMMVNVLKNHIVEKNNIATVISTHSPTTVIASEGISIYQLIRGENTPVKTSINEAVEMLSSDIPFLKISTEKRRQVFVESKYDVIYYELLTNIYSRLEALPAEPIYIPARTSSGSNCNEVKEIVKNLYSNGNEQIYGIVDWDLKNRSEDRILVLGENIRYSIENYILDPLLMGIFFIRENKIPISEFKNLSISRYSEMSKLKNDDAQIITNKVLADLELQSSEELNYQLYNNWNLNISKCFNDYQGHELESLYKSKYKFLNSYQREDSLKKEVIQKVINDYPGFAPIELSQIILKII